MIGPDIVEAGDKDVPRLACNESVSCADRRLGGIVIRKERWGFSWYGWLLVVFVLLLGTAGFVYTIFPFLAITQRVDSNVLVVEGWVPPFAIEAAVREFRSGAYSIVYTTGGPVGGMGGYTNDYNTLASVAATRLRAAGLAPEVVRMVPSRVMEHDRTYGAAVALRDWLRRHGGVPAKINVLTANAHARRTQLLFRCALGSRVQVGVISIQDPDYDPKRWWRYSDGVREVVAETGAWIYARLFFHPGEGESG
jgi:uncharacterized SAM-binding protein YcdF (DUF218 family)